MLGCPPKQISSVAILSIGLLLLFGACSGDIAGDVYVTMKSGDVKRGADVQVVLVREQFMDEWKKSGATFKAAYQEADAAYKEAQAEEAAAFKRHVAEISSLSSTTRSRGEYEAAGARAMEAGKRAGDVRDDWMAHTAKLIEWATVATARTDVNGHYEFKDVSRGKYYLVARHQVFSNEMNWLVPVEVRSAEKVDLSNSNDGSFLQPILAGL